MRMFLELLHNESYNSIARLGKYYVVKSGEGGIFWENEESFHIWRQRYITERILGFGSEVPLFS